jgi:enterochelin esterase-like enzyme
MKITRKAISITLAAAMVITTAAVDGTNDGINAAAKPKLSTKSVSVKVKESKKVTVKNAKGFKLTVKSKKKAIATASKKGNAAFVVKGVKAGNTKVVCTVKKGKKKFTLNCKVTVNDENNAKATDVPVATDVPATTAPTQAPAQNPTQAPTQAATQNPTQAPSATPEPTKASAYKPLKEFIEDDDFTIPDSDFNKKNDANRGTMKKIEYPSTVIKEGETVMRKANVCLPKDYDESKKYPVIYFAHGIGGNEDSMTGDNDVKDVLWNAVAEGVAEEAIMVFPSCCANEYNGQGPNEFFSVEHYRGYNNFLNDFKECLKPYIDENYSTLPDRENTAICGFSMGGRVTLHLGFTLQDTFRYIGAFCPAPGILDFSDNGVTDKGLFEPGDFKLDDQYRDDTLVMIFKGKTDSVVKTFPKEYHDALEDNDVPHVYLESMGGTDGNNGDGGHDGSVYNFGFYNFLRRIFKKN